jgi:hypothetical protein
MAPIGVSRNTACQRQTNAMRKTGSVDAAQALRLLSWRIIGVCGKEEERTSTQWQNSWKKYGMAICLTIRHEYRNSGLGKLREGQAVRRLCLSYYNL